ncbi:MAG: sterol desaturase family protein [Bacteroidetes bacterium]|nr:sterol desaturase family protein [Bacteroidota bacterium]
MNFLLLVVTFVLMEGVAWLTHRFVMHGLLWVLHKDHHQVKPGFFERNDFFFLIFALPGFLLTLFGTLNNFSPLFFIGLGITIYGFAYFLVHDVFIHQRLPILKRSNNFYLRAIRKAHKMHHKHLNKEEGECFGMLLVPLKYFYQELKLSKSK